MPATNGRPIYMILGARLQTGRFRVGVIMDTYPDPFLNNGFNSRTNFNQKPMLLVPDLIPMGGSGSDIRTGSN